MHTGSVAERLKAHAWKACRVKALAGSNPVTSALHFFKMLVVSATTFFGPVTAPGPTTLFHEDY